MAYDFPTSPTTGQIITGPNGIQYQWDGVKWLAAGSLGSSQPFAPYGVVNNVGRNLLHNPLFNIAQRGAGPFTTNAAYTLDRWRMDFALDTLSVNPVDISAVTTFGDEAAIQGLQIGCVGNAGAGAFSIVSQMVEGVRRLGGKTITVSFWAYATSGAPKLGVGMRQLFGTGGSPAATVDLTGQSITASTTPTRYSVTFALPTTIGKALGTNGDNYTRLSFWPSCGTTNAVTAGSPGVQTATFVLWGVQLEIGTIATPLEKPDPQQDLAKCQRFYQVGNMGFGGVASGAATNVFITVPLLVTMRAAPTVVPNYSGSSNIASQNVVAQGNSHVQPVFNVVGTGFYYGSGTYIASADL